MMTPQQRYSEPRDQKSESRPAVTAGMEDNAVIDSKSVGKSLVAVMCVHGHIPS